MRTILALVIPIVSGCVDELKPISQIERARVLGARVDLDGDPGRAAARAGEPATISWIVATPDGGPAELAWMFAACTGPGCREPFAITSGAGPAPAFPITIPAAAAPGSQVSIAGVVCERGTPRPSPEAPLPSCDGAGAIATPVAFSIEVAGELANRHPTPGALALAGEPWADGIGCGDPATRRVAAADSIEIAWLANDDRESYVAGDGVLVREILLLAAFVTAGEIEDHFAVIEQGDADLERTLAWKPPASAELSSTGELVHFTFVVRDGRGGLAVASRALCLVP